MVISRSAPAVVLAVAVLVGVALPTCTKEKQAASPPPNAAPPAAAPPPSPAATVPLDPTSATERAPDRFKAKLATSKGDIVIDVHRDWAPNGADRFYNLVKGGYYDGTRFFRVVSGFMVQWGIHGDPAVNARWNSAQIKDDPVKQSNTRGFVTFAMAGPDTRTTQVFINFVDNRNLDGMGFAPFGEVVVGMDVVDALNGEYGEGAPGGRGPRQDRMQREGNAYLEREFARLDLVRQGTIVP